MCPSCGEGARFRIDAELGGVPLWVCPEGHGTIRRAGSLPRPRRSPAAEAAAPGAALEPLGAVRA